MKLTDKHISNYLAYHYDEETVKYDLDQVLNTPELRNAVSILINEDEQCSKGIAKQDVGIIVGNGRANIVIHYESIIKFLIDISVSSSKFDYLKAAITLIFESFDLLKNEERCVCFIIADQISLTKSSVTKEQIKQYFQEHYDSERGYLCHCDFECERINHEASDICGYTSLDFIDRVINDLDERDIIEYHEGVISETPIFN